MNDKKTYKIDMHIHLAGAGTNSSGCWISDEFKNSIPFKFLTLLLGITKGQIAHSIDLDWAARISHLVSESGLDYGAALGFDGSYDQISGEIDRKKSQMIIPPDWVFHVCQMKHNLLPAPSINPHRKDALEVLRYAIAEHAVMIKWLPAAQAINMAHPNLMSFYQLLAQNNIPLLIHMGGERTFRTMDKSANNIALLEIPLKVGVKVICAHSGTKIFLSREKDQLPILRGLLKKYSHLYVDNAGMCNPARFIHVKKLTLDELFANRTIHGSDWPVPSNAYYFLRQLGWKRVRDLERIKNPLARDIAIKSALGYGAETLGRASEVLSNLDYWL